MKGETTGTQRAAGLSAVGELVRRHDRDRFMTVLFAPAARREALFALYAFNHEIARIREVVTQPMLGQIRLQWWREVVDTAFSGGQARNHPVAEPLTAAIREHRLSRTVLDRLIDSREFDLTDEPPPTMAALETYAEGTSASVVALALEILEVRSAGAVGAPLEIGIGYALAGLLRAMPFHARSGRCYIPAELAARARLDPGDYRELTTTLALRAVVEEIAETAEGHLRAGRRAQRRLPRTAMPALLPAVIAERALVRLRRARYDPFDPSLARPDPLQAWRLLAAMLRRRI